jgi:hypothetical protein
MHEDVMIDRNNFIVEGSEEAGAKCRSLSIVMA